MTALVPLTTRTTLPVLVQAAGPRAETCVLEFFAASIRNGHTRRAYARSVGDFFLWC